MREESGPGEARGVESIQHVGRECGDCGKQNDGVCDMPKWSAVLQDIPPYDVHAANEDTGSDQPT
ncbi:hypothetical protein GCM10027180_10550 [Microbulbifer echini]